MKNIIITGTSRGIGFELCKILSEKGHRILALSRNSETINALKLSNCTAFSFNLEEENDFEKVAHFIQNHWEGKVDILINNAGKLVNKPFWEISKEDFLAVYQVNVFGVAKLIQTALPFFVEGGNILNISSMGGVQGSAKFAGLSAYSSSKGAVITLTELLAEELKPKKISCNVLALGAVQTEMLSEAFPDYKTDTTPEQIAHFIADFVLHQAHLFNGKIIPVANSTP